MVKSSIVPRFVRFGRETMVVGRHTESFRHARLETRGLLFGAVLSDPPRFGYSQES